MRAQPPCLISGPNCAAVCCLSNRMRSFRDRFLRSNNHRFSALIIAALSRFVDHDRGEELGDTLGPACPSNFRIQHRKGWIRSSSTVAIQSRRACLSFRMQAEGEKPDLLDAVLRAHSLGFWLISQERAPRRWPLWLPHRAATTAPRAWLPGSPCARALATKVLRAWPPCALPTGVGSKPGTGRRLPGVQYG